MKVFSTIAAALAATAAAANIHETLQIIREVNSANVGWTAGINKGFENMTPELERAYCGAKVSAGKLREFPLVANELPKNDIPDSFDSRTQWPGYIGGIRNQAQCGSCWAFGATEFISDRFAIASQGAIKVTLSPQDLVSCDNKDGNMGCNGGYPIRALQYVRDTGIVSDDCYNYTSGGGDTGTCKLTFPSGPCPSQPGQQEKFYKLKDAYEVGTTVEAIQTEIMTNGPVEATFAVYQDFFSYKSGVYRHQTGGLAGYHAVKLLGWGVEESTSTPYWILANSWDTTWGDQGFFLMLRGSDECGIEDGITAGNPAV